MKNLIRSLFFLGIIYFVGVGCQETLADYGGLRKTTTSLNKVKIPEGTEINKISENQSYLDLPEDIFFVASKTNAKNSRVGIMALGGAGVRCKCTEGSGCNPTVMGGDYACVMTTGCTSCDLSTSRVGDLDSSFDDELVRVKGLVDYNQGITFLTESLSRDMMQNAFFSTKDKTYGSAFDELFELEKVRNGILEFYSLIYEGNIPQFILDNDKELPDGYSYVAVNIYGNVAVMPFPNKKIEQQNRMAVVMDFSVGISCKCHEGSGCKKKSAGMGSVKYCDAGDCTDCELTD